MNMLENMVTVFKINIDNSIYITKMLSNDIIREIALLADYNTNIILI